MSFAPSSTYFTNGNGSIQGIVTEKEFGNYFEYSMADDFVQHPDLKTGNNTEYPHMLWVTTPRDGIDQGWRRALVKKTVAYVVVDEDDYGRAVIERWSLKKHNLYPDANPTSPGQQLIAKIAN